MNMKIVAEIGTAHGGSFEKARELIDLAKDSGADAVKFQWVYASEILHPDTGFVKLPGGNIPLYDTFRALECSKDFYARCLEYAHSSNLEFYCSPFGLKSLEELVSIHPDGIKIASPEVNHFPMLSRISQLCTEIPVVISSGVSTLSDLEHALSLLSNIKDITLLHCITSYPAPEEEYNVRCIKTLSDIFGIKTGLSDHSRDPVLVPVLSTCLGGTMIEKHITISNDTDGLDDKVAVTGEGFAQMVHCVHQTMTVLERFAKDQQFNGITASTLNCQEQLQFGGKDILTPGQCEVLRQLKDQYGVEKIKAVLGTGVKKLAPAEKDNYGRTNRSLHYMNSFEKGHVITQNDLSVLRTEKILTPGISPEYLKELEGCTLTRPVKSGEGVKLEHFLTKEC